VANPNSPVANAFGSHWGCRTAESGKTDRVMESVRATPGQEQRSYQDLRRHVDQGAVVGLEGDAQV